MRYIHRNFWAFYEKLTLLRERRDECLLNVEKIILHEKIHLFAIKIEILGELECLIKMYAMNFLLSYIIIMSCDEFAQICRL